MIPAPGKPRALQTTNSRGAAAPVLPPDPLLAELPCRDLTCAFLLVHRDTEKGSWGHGGVKPKQKAESGGGWEEQRDPQATSAPADRGGETPRPVLRERCSRLEEELDATRAAVRHLLQKRPPEGPPSPSTAARDLLAAVSGSYPLALPSPPLLSPPLPSPPLRPLPSYLLPTYYLLYLLPILPSIYCTYRTYCTYYLLPPLLGRVPPIGLISIVILFYIQ